MGLLYRCLAWVLLAASVLEAQGGDCPPLRPAVQTHGESDGLPHLSVNQLVPDREGRIWAATQDGIAVTSGHGWTVVPLPKTCRSSYVRAILPSRDGALWVGTQDDGLWELRRGQWRKQEAAQGFEAQRVNALEEVVRPEGPPWILAGTSTGGLLVLRDGRWLSLPGVPDPWVWRIRKDPERPGWFLLATGKGVAAWSPSGAWQAEEACPPARGFEVNDLVRMKDAAGRWATWVSIWGQGVMRWDGLHWVREASPSLNLTTLVAGPGPDGGEVLWASGYKHGIFWRKPDGTWEMASFLSPGRLRAAYWILPRWGHRPSLWIGLHGGGVLAADMGSWKSPDLPFAETGATTYALAATQDQAGRHQWIATTGGLAEWHRGRWRVHTQRDGLPDDLVESLCWTRAFGKPGLLASTLQGLALWREGRWTPVNPFARTWRSAITMLETEGDQGPVLWLGGNQGLLRYAKGTWEELEPPGGLSRFMAYALLETREPDGRRVLWVGTRGEGLLKRVGDRWERIGRAEGFPHPSVYALVATPRPGGHYRLWAGTQGGGLGYWDSDAPQAAWRWLTQDSVPALPSQAVVALAVLGPGRLLLGTHRGALEIRIPGGTDGTPEAWVVRRYGAADGLPSQICYDRSLQVDADTGRVWVGTVRGLAVFEAGQPAAPEQEAPVLLDRAWIGNREVEAAPSYHLDYRQRQAAFAFALPVFRGVDEQRFRTQLLPLEEGPGPWQPLGRRELSGLAPGAYRLRVWARDHLGRVSGPMEIALQVDSPPWRRPWAWAGYGVLLLGLAWWGVRWRVRNLRRRNRELEGLIRAAVADVEEQKESLARLNEEKTRMMGILAHDLRNPLGAMRLYAEGMAEGDIQADELPGIGSRLQKATDRMLDMVSRLLDITAIDTGQVRLDLKAVDPVELFEAVQEEQAAKARAKGQVIRIVQGEGAGPLRADALFLKEALDNLVSNALKFMPAGPPERAVVLRAGPGWVEVQDEGPGFSPEDLGRAFGRFERLSAKPTGGESSTGLGLSIVRGLVEVMGGRITLASEPGQGARFRIHLPRA